MRNLLKHRIACKKWREKNREYSRLKSKEHYYANKDKYIENAKRWAKENPEKLSLRDKTPKAKVRSKLRDAIHRGKIKKRNSCEICHNSPTECHHEDYSKPLEFVELCKKCHTLLHKQYKSQGILIT